MHDRRLVQVLVVIGGVATLLLLLRSVMLGFWLPILGAVAFVGVLAMVVRARHPAYLAFGVLVPFGITLPFVSGLPILGLVLALGIAERAARYATGGTAPSIRSWDGLAMIFHLSLLGIYLRDPALPGVALGLSQDITGFRSWLDHAMDFGLLVFLGHLITSRQDVSSLFRWLRRWALVFAVAFMVLMFVPSWRLTLFLKQSSVFVSYFGNGWRRFVFLPTMGMFLLLSALLPTLFDISCFRARLLVPVGLAAIIAGGNRGSIVGLLVQLGVISLRKGKFIALSALAMLVALSMLAANALLEHNLVGIENPLMRVMTTFSPKLAEASGSLGTMEWRMVRWRRAVEDIRKHPWAGLGYGGVSDYFALLSPRGGPTEELAVERDLATGSTHNGYISAARALGIPITVMFVLLLPYRIYRHWRLAGACLASERLMGEAHLFICSYLAMFSCMLLVSAEIRAPVLWFFIGLGFILENMGNAGDPLQEPAPLPPLHTSD